MFQPSPKPQRSETYPLEINPAVLMPAFCAASDKVVKLRFRRRLGVVNRWTTGYCPEKSVAWLVIDSLPCAIQLSKVTPSSAKRWKWGASTRVLGL